MRLLLLYLAAFYLQVNPIIIQIDASKEDNLNLSQISENIIPIPLALEALKERAIENVFIINGNIFILQRYQENGDHYSDVFMFDFFGNYIRRLNLKNTKKDPDPNILGMYFNDADETIMLIYSSGYGIFNKTGNLLNYRNQSWIDNTKLILYKNLTYYNGELWYQGILRSDNNMSIRLINADISFRSKNAILYDKPIPPESDGFIPELDFSTYNNELYFFSQLDNTIYKIEQDAINPKYIIDIKGLKSPIVRLNTFFFDRYIRCNYLNSGSEYEIIFDLISKSSFNIKYQRDQKGFYTSGIRDDINNTGYLKIFPTNLNEYAYFIKNHEEIKENVTNKGEVFLYLIKLN